MPHKEEYAEFTPNEYPPFPDSPEFPTVQLETISVKKLEDGDEEEQERAFQAFKGRGFVYLELAGTEKGDTILKGADEVARAAEKTMALPFEEKMKYKPANRELFGYVLLQLLTDCQPRGQN
jgi:isopenicillin N synthase-like dioxygenase